MVTYPLAQSVLVLHDVMLHGGEERGWGEGFNNKIEGERESAGEVQHMYVHD